MHGPANLLRKGGGESCGDFSWERECFRFRKVCKVVCNGSDWGCGMVVLVVVVIGKRKKREKKGSSLGRENYNTNIIVKKYRR